MCAPVREIFDAVGFLDVKEKDQQDETNTNIPVIIPAAGEAPAIASVLKNTPKAMIDIAGKTLLARQAQTLNQNHLTDVTVVTGYAGDKMKGEGISFLRNKDYKKGTELDSLLTAQEKMHNGFLMLYSDILLENHVIAQLLASKEDIVLVLDNSIQYLEVGGGQGDRLRDQPQPPKPEPSKHQLRSPEHCCQNR